MLIEVLLLFAATASFASAEVPSYIHVCGLRNPNLDQCIIDSVNDLAEILRIGDPDLHVPPSEPFMVDKVTLADLPNFKAFGTNIKIYGLPSYHIKSLHFDREKHYFETDMYFEQIKLVADYNVTARILVPIAGGGPITLTSENVGTNVRMDYKIVERKGKKYMYFWSMTTKLDVKDFKAKFESQNFDKTVQEAINQAFGSSHQEVINTSRPNIENAISKRVLELGNTFCQQFTYDELFPDRE